MKRDNFTGRYIVKFASSIILAVTNAIIQFLLPRALSVEMFGYYSYNLNVFTSIVVLTNLSTSSAMVSKFSKRNEEIGIVDFYLRYVAVVNVLLNAIILLVSALIGLEGIFKGQSLVLVLLGLNASIVVKLLSDVISMYDAMAISRFPAIIQAVGKVVSCVIVMVFYLISLLFLECFYIIQILITGLSVFLLVVMLKMDHAKQYTKEKKRSNKEYMLEFWSFCKPLVFVACWAQINILIMNWALMTYAGEIEQAMFGIALQLNTLISYVFSPYAELMKREYAVLSKECGMLKEKFVQSLKQMFWITTYFSVFIIVLAEKIIWFLYGEEYLGAVNVTQIMMVYTIYQSWGQMAGSFLLATEKTKLQAKLSYVSLVLTPVLIFLLQFPNGIFPHGLGTIGIALNYAICNIIATNVSVMICLRTLRERLSIVFSIQFRAVIECVLFSLLAKAIVEFICNAVSLTGVVFFEVMTAGVIYTGLVLVSILFFPNKMGLNRSLLIRKNK